MAIKNHQLRKKVSICILKKIQKEMKSNQYKKIAMWHKIKSLINQGLNKSQISRELSIDRGTIRKYINMGEEEFYNLIERGRVVPKKLDKYHIYIKEQLELHSYLSSSQIEDRLKESFKDFPKVDSKTIYNFVQSIRKRYGIKKDKDNGRREYEKLAETDYGKQAQVDFGESIIESKTGLRQKVYFFAMVLSRSRQKYVYFQTKPFTSETAILSHQKAFEYFEGEPKEIIYDQDKVLLKDENLGDLLMTEVFRTYLKEKSFTPIFCRKSDPESKGKIENVIGYVKNNFLRGRMYINEELLNQSVLTWLLRTGNGKIHSGTKKVPQEEWAKEKLYLQPFQTIKSKESDKKLYKVRKDNTINYKSNFYSLPLGTYQGRESCVLLKEVSEELYLYNQKEELIAIHKLSKERGVIVSNTDHRRDKSQSILKLKQEVLNMIKEKQRAELYIEEIQKHKPRYVRDNLLVLKKHIPEYSREIISVAIEFSLENNLYNATRFVEVCKYIKSEQEQKQKLQTFVPPGGKPIQLDAKNTDPQKSKLITYQKIM